MKKLSCISVITILLSLFSTSLTLAHFGMIIPSDDIITQEDSKDVHLDIMFIHPMEGHYMNMEKPTQFGVMINGGKTDLRGTLKKKKVNNFTVWETDYKIKRPANYVFYDEPTPYWEPAEDCFIIHYTKVIVNALGIDTGWDKEVGLKTEIIPLSRPYGIWTGNLFQGIVKVDGNPVPYAEVEVEYYNKDGKIKPESDPFVTQVVKADQNGVFSYCMPKAGWWGFAALNTDSTKIKHNGEDKEIEIGAVLWIKTSDMK
ncbi:MAG: DUF4198 domain-containing protein [bacterium]